MVGKGNQREPHYMVKSIFLCKCLDVFKGILNTLPYHAKDHKLGRVLILHHLEAKSVHNNDQEGFEGL